MLNKTKSDNSYFSAMETNATFLTSNCRYWTFTSNQFTYFYNNAIYNERKKIQLVLLYLLKPASNL